MLLVGFLAVFFSPRLNERIAEFSQSVESIGQNSQQILDPTAQLRVDSWQEGLRIWRKQPLLGVGFGGYQFAQNFAEKESHAATGSDSSLLNVVATTGIIGFGIFGIFLSDLVATSWRKRKIGFLAAGSGLLVHSIFVNSLFFAPLAAFFFITAGMSIRNEFKKDNPQSE